MRESAFRCKERKLIVVVHNIATYEVIWVEKRVFLKCIEKEIKITRFTMH